MNERELEIVHLSQTIDWINLEKQLIKKQQQALAERLQSGVKELTENKINTGNEEAFYESVLVYQEHEKELQLKYQTAEAQEKRLKTLTTMSGNPYFARIDFTEGAEPQETLYLGIASMRNPQDEPIIVDWRAPIANLYYEGELGPTFYETDDLRFEVDLQLKRQFKIKDGHMLSMVDTSEVINDEFLLEILDEASSSQMKNIVSTIQKSQNAIIRDTEHKMVLIEGIAGSGKTSALLQRVAFLLYRHRKWLKDDHVLLFSPNHLFSDYISMVLPSLGESEVPTRTFRTFLNELLPTYQIQQEVEQEDVFLSGQEDQIERAKNSLHLIDRLTHYIETIQPIGPLFRDLKIKGTTYISKEQIRQWYGETNELLPLYQRTQLLQTKLLKKLAGIERDEMKKPWLQELAEEKMTEIFEADPHKEYTEASEKALRKKVRQQLARRKFRAMKRGITNYQFINVPKQYLHFLQIVTPKILVETGTTIAEWTQNFHDLRVNFREKTLKSEDGLLLFLLTKQLYPVHVEQKARFIFIDEMQDFPPAQVALLRSLYPDASITLCGDLNQKVFGNETIVHQLPKLFPDYPVERYQLTTSYRSTAEITAFANQLLSQEDTVRLTARTGPLPEILSGSTDQQVTYLTNQIKTTDASPSHWRTAIIAKTTQDCCDLYEQLDEEVKQLVQLIDSEDSFMKRPIIIIPAFLAKGLEFDRVFAWNVSEQFQDSQDQLILYTIATRAMHQLVLLTDGHSPLLGQLSDELANTHSL